MYLGVFFPVDQDAEEEMRKLYRKEINYVQLAVDTLNEAIKLEVATNIETPEDLNKVSSFVSRIQLSKSDFGEFKRWQGRAVCRMFRTQVIFNRKLDEALIVCNRGPAHSLMQSCKFHNRAVKYCVRMQCTNRLTVIIIISCKSQTSENKSWVVLITERYYR